jgi:polyisoprenyl-phosphate glycosyltransferase
LPSLHERLAAVLRQIDWEWIIVDDHSSDDTFGVIASLASVDPRIRGIRLARNCGSHIAIACGLHHAGGDAAALVVSDLQDPPELLAQMLERWRDGAQVVWAVRRLSPGDARHRWFASIYYWIMRRLVGLTDMPPTGVDYFLVDRVVIDACRASMDRHVSVFALIMWLGFRRAFVEYDKQPRASGQSGWTLARKVKLVVDSIVGFSAFPIWWCLYAGAAAMLLSPIPLVAALLSYPGFNAALWLLAALVIGLFGCQLLALGIVGLYVWRALDEARGRPLYAIEAVAGPTGVPVAVAADWRRQNSSEAPPRTAETR